eukprot:Amastigsp_a841166_36.p3 type:complete len:104 gc:universal Amastigsp_a841166_36:1-312(+)
MGRRRRRSRVLCPPGSRQGRLVRPARRPDGSHLVRHCELARSQHRRRLAALERHLQRRLCRCGQLRRRCAYAVARCRIGHARLDRVDCSGCSPRFTRAGRRRP